MGEENNNQQTQQTTTQQTEQKAEKTFTQEEVSRLLAREKEEGRRAVLKELGEEDFKSAKEGIDNYKKFLESQKTDLDKAKEAAEAEKAEKEALKKQLDASNERLKLLEEGCTSEKVADVLALVKSRTSEKVTFDDAIKQIRTDYPNLFNSGEAKGTGGSVNPQNRPSGNVAGSYGERIAKAQTSAANYNYFKH